MKGDVPLPAALALLRLLRRVEPHPEDEDALFDEFGVVGREQTLTKAAARLIDAGRPDSKMRDRQLDGLLAEMLRDYHNRRRIPEAA